jgi:FkbM family methyltransferase
MRGSSPSDPPGDRFAATEPRRVAAPIYESANLRLQQTRYGVMAYPKRDKFIGRSLDLYGEWAQRSCGQIVELLQPGDVVCDVGANVGAITLMFARHVPEGAVYAFEPVRAHYQLLVTNVTLNELTNVAPFHAAVGAAGGRIRAPRVPFSLERNLGAIALEDFAEDGEEVPLIRIDDLKLPACALLKIDVEGMEADVVRGAAATLDRCRPLLFVENERPDRSTALIELLIDLGYDCYWMFGELYNPDNYRGERENVFGEIGGGDMICVHRSRGIAFGGLDRAERGDSFAAALERNRRRGAC